MVSAEDTLTAITLENDDDRILILDGRQRQEYFTVNTTDKRHCGLFEFSVPDFFKRLNQ